MATETCPYALRLRFPDYASEGAIRAISHVVGHYRHDLGRLLAREAAGAAFREREGDGLRVRALEESMWQRAVDGDASAAEVLFYLANRAPGRWQDLKRIRHEVEHGGGVLLVPTSTPDDEREWGELARKQQEQLKERTRDGQWVIEANSTEA